MDTLLKVHKVPASTSIFKYTEPPCSTSPSGLADIITSCEVLRDNVHNSCRGLSQDVHSSLAEFNSASETIAQPRVRKWRSQAQYSKGRNHILSLLSGRNQPHDQETDEVFSRLMFRQDTKTKTFSDRFKFTVPEVLSPRMAQLFRSNKRPFGGNFHSPAPERRHGGTKEKEDSIEEYLKGEIGKYNSSRMKRVLRIPEPHKRKSVIIVTLPNTPEGKNRRRESVASHGDSSPTSLYYAHKRGQKSVTQFPAVHKHHDSEPGMEHTIMADIRKAKNDAAEALRTEKLMVGTQAVNLSSIKTFKANLKDSMQRK